MLNNNTVAQAGSRQSEAVKNLYRQAAQDEQQFLDVMNRLGYDVRPSTTDQDRYEDIDFVIHKGDEVRTLSLKTTRFRAGRVPLEIACWVYKGDGEPPRRGYESVSELHQSWFLTSKADVFVFETNGMYYFFNAAELREHLAGVMKPLTYGRKSVWLQGDKMDFSRLAPTTPRNRVIADSYTLWFSPEKHLNICLGCIHKNSGVYKVYAKD
jgi:hypothetical protein